MFPAVASGNTPLMKKVKCGSSYNLPPSPTKSKAYWAGVGGNLSPSNDHLRIGVVQYFFRHTVSIQSSPTQSKCFVHLFAYR